jgi:hypothetical protein
MAPSQNPKVLRGKLVSLGQNPYGTGVWYANLRIVRVAP